MSKSKLKKSAYRLLKVTDILSDMSKSKLKKSAYRLLKVTDILSDMSKNGKHILNARR
jgi:hypothetical protein